ncbi:hypothetical protein LQ948_12860 [Jiella sp. MQZ9-1]|uniref:Uncharacterized protein n=1 Tax=Jiella flava TaxID=2816857 RepID=A0A939G1P8_9HYPH|nr:hypothetical protein [Jiella flava]MBO0663527.1 hypothetical protein [Jiella flava]MCD2472102.1 hypothetical protein [Jiella flava]
MVLPTEDDLSPVAPPGDKEADREVAKLTAAFLNGLAVGLAIVGGVAPIFNSMYAARKSSFSWWQLASISIVCLIASAAIHLATRAYLRRELRR